MLNTIKINYSYTNNTYKTYQYLDNLPDLFAADFEIASNYTKEDKELTKIRLDFIDNKLTTKNFPNIKKRQIQLNQRLCTDGLSHPSLTSITHLSIATDESNAFVIVCDNNNIRKLVLNFLVSTNKTQIWHKSIFDFKHIYYHTGKYPKRFIDTQLMAKSLLNDANSFKGLVGLKQLMSYAYGDWAISKDSFVLEEMWKENTIKYAAIDACATYKLYKDILQDLTKWKI